MLLSVPLMTTPRIGRRFITPLAAALLLAWLPSLTFVGHWEQLMPGAPKVEQTHSHRADQAHAEHCHEGVAACADHAPAQSPAVARTLEAALIPPETRIPLTNDAVPPADSETTPSTPPPRLHV